MTGGTRFLKSIFRKPLRNNLIETVFAVVIYIHLNFNSFFALYTSICLLAIKKLWHHCIPKDVKDVDIAMMMMFR